MSKNLTETIFFSLFKITRIIIPHILQQIICEDMSNMPNIYKTYADRDMYLRFISICYRELNIV